MSLALSVVRLAERQRCIARTLKHDNFNVVGTKSEVRFHEEVKMRMIADLTPAFLIVVTGNRTLDPFHTSTRRGGAVAFEASLKCFISLKFHRRVASA